MATGLSLKFILQASKEFLDIVNQENGEGEDLVHFKTAVKFLMARKFDVGRALDLYNAHQVYLCNDYGSSKGFFCVV